MPHLHLQDRALTRSPYRWARTEVTFFGPAYKADDVDRWCKQECSNFIAHLPKDEAEDLVLASRRLALELELWKVNNRRYPRELSELKALRHELDDAKRLCRQLAHPIHKITFFTSGKDRSHEVLVLESLGKDRAGRVAFYHGANVGISHGILNWGSPAHKRLPRRSWLKVLKDS